MTDKIKEQLMVIRDSGFTNMFDIPRVRQIATDLGYDDLVEYLDQNRKSYARFILYGDDSE